MNVRVWRYALIEVSEMDRQRSHIFFFQAEDGIRVHCVTGVQTCALPISKDEKGEPASIPQMTGEDLKLSGTRQDFDQNGQPNVLMQFTGEGEDKFHEVTRDEAVRGQTQQNLLDPGRTTDPQQFAQHFAIVLDREIRSFPQIDYTNPQLRDGISGGSAEITGIGSLGEAKDLALVLQTGALPV